MKLVFIDQTGCLAALVAASYLTGRLTGRVSCQEIMELRDFGKGLSKLGQLQKIGLDTAGNTVYTLSAGAEAALVQRSARDLLSILPSKELICLLDFSAYNSSWLNLGSYLSQIPILGQIILNLAAKRMKDSLPKIMADVTAQLKELGLEYSNLDLLGDNQG